MSAEDLRPKISPKSHQNGDDEPNVFEIHTGLEAMADEAPDEISEEEAQELLSKSFVLPYEYAQLHQILYHLEENQLWITRETPSLVMLSVLSFLHPRSKKPEVITHEPVQFIGLLERFYADRSIHRSSDVASKVSDEVNVDAAAAMLEEVSDLLSSEDDAPIIRLLNAIFFEAIQAKASDVHIEPFEKHLYVRMRVDGVLQTRLQTKAHIAPLLISRIKVLARLDIAEKRVPQDGRIAVRIGGRSIDLRISTLPSAYNERVVMRLLDKGAVRLDLDSLGMPSHILKQFKKVLARPNGIFLVTGPTGSGKTTTLYAGLEQLDRQALNIMTVEDPLEYFFEGISQTQVNVKAGMTFARGLRSILRQDPDVVMIGEIRDKETAQIAIQASLTGHLVLSTLHTNSALGAITRLNDMGLEPFLVASTLQATLAQRLVRRLCSSCRKSRPIMDSEKFVLETEGLYSDVLYEPAGCEDCSHTGFAGRLGVYELVMMDAHLRHMINAGESEMKMADYAFLQEGSISLKKAALERAISGDTSYYEAMRIASGD